MTHYPFFMPTIVSLVAIPIIMAPSIIAASKRLEVTLWVLLLNATLWWTGIGWISALVWALLEKRQLQRIDEHPVYQRTSDTVA